MTQREALTLLKTGANVFITGPAGSGKTHVINEYIQYLREREVPIGITASTGIAATHMGGVTVHSWTGMGIRDYMDESDYENIAGKAYLANRIKGAQVLIIDEVSMLHHFRLDMVDGVARHVRKNEEPFGGLQVVLCGDFFQLPPVSRYGEPEAQFIYRSDAWKAGSFSVCYLSENYRQTDDVHLKILNEIRDGEVSDAAREHLKARHHKRTMPEIEPTRLYTHNVDVDAVNDAELAKVDAPEFLYEMDSTGKKPLVDALKKSCLAPEQLRLRKGVRVMCVKNNFDKGYVNGTLGVVVSCGPGVDPIIRTAPSAEFPQGRQVVIEPATWSIEEDGKVLAKIVQYPLRLAWAMTVHKSQGMSLDAIEVDLSKSFEPGMGYVALSRVRTLNGLTILGMNEAALRVHPEVLEYDRHLRELSARAESVLAGTDEKEIKRLQDEFLARVAPMHSMQGGAGKKGRGKKGKGGARSASAPGKVSTFAQTAALFRKNKSIRDIAAARELSPETVVSHIEKLVAEPDLAGDEPFALSDVMYLKKEISPAHWRALEKALEEAALAQEDEGAAPLLSVVKNKVGANVSFLEIRLARVLLGYSV